MSGYPSDAASDGDAEGLPLYGVVEEDYEVEGGIGVGDVVGEFSDVVVLWEEEGGDVVGASRCWVP